MHRAKEEGAAAAASVLAEHWDGYLPVKPSLIARIFEIEVIPRDLGPLIAGRIQRQGGNVCVHINSSEPEARRRFTLAHEIGHFIKHRGRDFAYEDYRNALSKQGTDKDEIYANSFAAELLMPEVAIRGLMALRVQEVQMAREFKVSPEAMVIRLKDLGWYPL